MRSVNGQALLALRIVPATSPNHTPSSGPKRCCATLRLTVATVQEYVSAKRSEASPVSSDAKNHKQHLNRKLRAQRRARYTGSHTRKQPVYAPTLFPAEVAPIVSNRHNLFDTIVGFYVAPHPDGYKFIAIAAACAAAFFLIEWPVLAWIMTVLTVYVIYFFRDPDRVAPLRDGLVISAADGEISSIERVKPPAELGLGDTERVRVSTFLSVFDVHINRAPIAGRIKRSVYIPGAFLNAALDKASEENERRALVIETSQGVEIGVVQIAGLVARRIVTFASEGQTVGIGERFGLIRFGSRVDIYLPPGKTALVAVGQRAVGGETVFADLKSDEPPREARRL